MFCQIILIWEAWGRLGKAGEGWGRLFAPNAEQRRRRSLRVSSWSQRAFMQTFTIAVIDSPVACVGVDRSSKAWLPLPVLVSDTSGIVYHDQHQQICPLYQGKLRDGSNFPSCFASLTPRPQLSFRVSFSS
ncbi:hypothetical protein EAE99_011132 [Botrytis elliptica]|nr:hypothetical protein EAE99_011132 [Botrytis elliptica]